MTRSKYRAKRRQSVVYVVGGAGGVTTQKQPLIKETVGRGNASPVDDFVEQKNAADACGRVMGQRDCEAKPERYGDRAADPFLPRIFFVGVRMSLAHTPLFFFALVSPRAANLVCFMGNQGRVLVFDTFTASTETLQSMGISHDESNLK